MNPKFTSFFVIFIISGLAIFYFIHLGFYPVAIVNSNALSASKFNKVVDSVNSYYEKTYKNLPESKLNNQSYAVQVELRRATLDKLVEDMLVDRELEAQFGSQTASMIENKLDLIAANNPDFADAVSALYGLEIKKFKEIVLAPQAAHEILAVQLKEIDKAADFENWLKQERRSARVIILAPDLKWDGEKVSLR